MIIDIGDEHGNRAVCTQLRNTLIDKANPENKGVVLH
jgi:hypothetical protein